MGAKTFEQAAGFLRIQGGDHPLDGSAVHPERHALVEQMASDAGVVLTDLMQSSALRSGIRIEKYVSQEAYPPCRTSWMSSIAPDVIPENNLRPSPC